MLGCVVLNLLVVLPPTLFLYVYTHVCVYICVCVFSSMLSSENMSGIRSS